MAYEEGGSRETSSPNLRDKPSSEQVEDQWRAACRNVAWVVANTGLTWDDVIDMSPLRLKFVANAVKRRRAFDTLSIFDAQAALIDEKSLNRLNRELRDAQK